MGRERKEIRGLTPIIAAINGANAISEHKRMGGIYIFCSFDIVNSTEYKVENASNWSGTIGEILQNIIAAFANSSLGGYKFWKTLGDEIVYTREVYSKEDIYDTVEDIYAKLELINRRITRGIICDIRSGDKLGVKGTAWIADVSSHSHGANNLHTEYRINDNLGQTEFLGPDIDIGFRIAEYSMKNRLVVSYKLAYILMKYQHAMEYPNKLVLLSFRALQGIWRGRQYPIIIYHGDETTKFLQSIQYPIPAKESLLMEYFDNVERQSFTCTPGGYCCYECEKLELLREEAQSETKLTELIDAIDAADPPIMCDISPVMKF